VETVDALRALQTCVAKLKQAYLKSHTGTALPRICVVYRGAGYFTFILPHVFHVNSSPTDNAFALRALLDCLIEINSAYLAHFKTKALYDSGVVYDRTQIWDTIPALYARRYGDCKSLSAALIAQYHQFGIEANPTFRFVKNSRGTSDFHILVQTPQGFEDPSKVLGMGRDENAYFKS
jgi:hypothetical protein